MRHLILTLFIFLFISCVNNNTTADNHLADSNYGNKLIEYDFLQYADSLKTDSLVVQIESSFNIYDDRINKFVHIDAEELAEFQFSFFLPELNKILEKRNFHIDLMTKDNYETTNEVYITGEKTKLYSKDEMAHQDFWDLASRRFFMKVNQQLKSQNIKETFFLLYQGNDLHAFLLTDKQQKIIADKYKDEPDEIPYSP